MLSTMTTPTSFAMLIATAKMLWDMVNTRDNLHVRPDIVRKAVAMRLASGLIVLRTFLRRLIILIALDLEWRLVDKRGPMKRPHKSKAKPGAKFHLPILDAQKGGHWLYNHNPDNYPGKKSYRGDLTNPAVYVDMAKLYAKLDFLAGIAADPFPKARRLAYHLARTHTCIILPREGPEQIAGRYGTQVRAYYDNLPTMILEASRNRPPPLPPPRNHWPMITAL
jgi:hypothetical protein